MSWLAAGGKVWQLELIFLPAKNTENPAYVYQQWKFISAAVLY